MYVYYVQYCCSTRRLHAKTRIRNSSRSKIDIPISNQPSAHRQLPSTIRVDYGDPSYSVRGLSCFLGLASDWIKGTEYAQTWRKTPLPMKLMARPGRRPNASSRSESNNPFIWCSSFRTRIKLYLLVLLRGREDFLKDSCHAPNLCRSCYPRPITSPGLHHTSPQNTIL